MLLTPLHHWHETHGGRMVDFAGWSMPVQYSTIVEEHNAVRNGVGLFDISHMGRLRFSGPQACDLLDRLVTNDVAGLAVGDVRYALCTNEQGGILDDVLVYRFPNDYLMVCNASNRDKLLSWIGFHSGDFTADVEDQTVTQVMIAVQGPQAINTLKSLVPAEVLEQGYYQAMRSTCCGEPAIISRTGYTGEDGFEVIASADRADHLWDQILRAGESAGIISAGLGCRDTLRLEAGMPLYGHELDESIDPYTAGLGFGVKLNAADFIGKDAVTQSRENSNRKKRVGLELEGKRIARQGAVIEFDGQPCGGVTSGTFSPTLQKTIAMGYVAPEQAQVGTTLQVDIRGTKIPAVVVRLPFYKRTK